MKEYMSERTCCTPEQLEAFANSARKNIKACPGWHMATNDGFVIAYCGMIETLDLCQCKLIILGRNIANENVWRAILEKQKFSPEELIQIGKTGKVHWQYVLAAGSVFSEPMTSDSIWEIASHLDSGEVWVSAIETGLLTPERIKELVTLKPNRDSWYLAVPIVKTKVLNHKEILAYIRSQKNYAEGPAVAYIESYNLSAKQLREVAEKVEAQLPGSAEDVWVAIMKHPNNPYSPKEILALLEKYKDKDELKIAVLKSDKLTREEVKRMSGNASKRVLREMVKMT